MKTPSWSTPAWISAVAALTLGCAKPEPATVAGPVGDGAEPAVAVDPPPATDAAAEGAADPPATTAAKSTPPWAFIGATDPKAVDTTIAAHRKLRAAVRKAGKDDFEENARAAWFDYFHAEAKAGRMSVVRFPLLFCVGWGCETPSDWAVRGCNEEPTTWIRPAGDAAFMDSCSKCYEIDDESRHMSCRERNCDGWVIEGYFTGKQLKRGGEPCSSGAYEFHVLRHSQKASRADVLGLPAGSGPPDALVVADGPRYGVVFTNFPRSDARARDKADSLAAKLRKAGHSGVAVVDSRLYPALWCCSWVVVVDRFDDEASAKALAKRLRKTAKGAAVRALY